MLMFRHDPVSPMIRRVRRWQLWLPTCLAALIFAAPVHATSKFSKAALSTLPAYCMDSELSPTYARFGPKWQYWTSLMGDNFNRIHHYCEGLLLVASVRKESTSSQARRITLRRAISEYDFILGYPPEELQKFPLWPEMLLRRAEAAVLLEDWDLAYSSFELARQVKPDYWPAYVGWAEVLLKSNLKKEALALLKQGLLINPTAEPMRQMYAKLGGALREIPNEPPKPAEPEPAASEPEPTADAASAPAR